MAVEDRSLSQRLASWAIRGRSRPVSAFGLYGEGREVLRSASRLFDRSDRKGRTNHEGRGPGRCPIAERGDGQGEDFFERGGREGAWRSRRLPRAGCGSQFERRPRCRLRAAPEGRRIQNRQSSVGVGGVATAVDGRLSYPYSSKDNRWSREGSCEKRNPAQYTGGQHDEKKSDVRYRLRIGDLGKQRCLVRRRESGGSDQSLGRGQVQLAAGHRTGRRGPGSTHRSEIRNGRRQADAVDLHFGEGIRHGRGG